METNYTVGSIEKLAFFDAVRKSPGMYIGSVDADGLHHLPKEIINNSVDEFMNSDCCTRIDVILHKDGSLTVQDDGRGIPIGQKEGEKKTAAELCFTEEHAGGKFLNATGESGYNTSGGMHGLGTKCVNALSDKMSVVCKNENGKVEYLEFVDGIEVEHKIVQTKEKDHGLTVRFYPSDKYFETTEFDPTRIKKLMEEYSFLNKGLIFNFTNEKDNDKVTYQSHNGMYDFLQYLTKEKGMICNPFYFEEEEGTFSVEIAFGYNSTYNPTIKLFTNSIPQKVGKHLTGFKTAFTSCMNSFAKEQKWLKEGDANLTGDDLAEGMLLVINFKMIDPVFKGQNKEDLASSEGQTYVQRFTNKALKELFEEDPKNVKVIFDKAIAARKAREAAKKARDNARQTQVKKKDAFLEFENKLTDCSSEDRENCEIYIIEGDSAGGNMKIARNKQYQAVLPLRGKLLNVEKATLDKIMKNNEIKSMILAFGLQAQENKLIFKKEDLRYGKIIIMTDADVDGAHISILMLTFLWRFCPELIEQGYVYLGVPPLYRITTNKDRIYLKDDAALVEYKKQNVGKKFQVNRMKGLGEMDPDETEATLIHPETRIIRQVTVNDIKATDTIISQLMGDNAIYRKKLLKEHGHEARYTQE